MPTLVTGETTYQLNIDPPKNNLSKQYLTHLLNDESLAARQLILEAVESGFPIKRLYTEVFQWSQREVGYLWETGQINVADEHFITATTQSLMAQLYPYIRPKLIKNKKAIITCVPSELHEIGARMVADYLTMDGWDTYFLGANTPIDSLIEKIQTKTPLLLGISVTMSHHIPQLLNLIDKIKENARHSSLKIIVGGRPFIVSPSLCKNLPLVDACMNDVSSLLDLANNLVSEVE
ncbi:cobalamin-dependent protein [bacterium]|nr:cobalamin-dependent protein [bacterium]